MRLSTTEEPLAGWILFEAEAEAGGEPIEAFRGARLAFRVCSKIDSRDWILDGKKIK